MLYIVDGVQYETVKEAKENGTISAVIMAASEYNRLASSIAQMKKVVARQRDKTMNRDTYRNSEMLDLTKIEHLPNGSSWKTTGTFNTALDEDLSYEEVYNIVRSDIGKVVYKNFKLSKIIKLYLFDNKKYTKNENGEMQKDSNFWYLQAELK